MHWGLRAIPVGIVIVYAAIVIALCDPGMAVFGPLYLTYGESMASVWVIIGLYALLVTLARRRKRGEPGTVIGITREFFASRWRSDRFASVIVPFFCFVTIITAYNMFKALYLPSAGFWFGHYIARSERFLLGGYDAWQLTHMMLPTAWATQVIDSLYHSWFAPMVIGVTVCSFVNPSSRLAWRYLTSYLLLWSVQGSLIAYFMPAAGPALHSAMHNGDSKFAALNVTLQAQDAFLRSHGAPGLISLQSQHALAAVFGQPTVAIGSGISAMPSLHNGMAVLFACAAWGIGRRTGMLATVFALSIWVGSVHLGWHYALDGIVAALLTVLTWIGVGKAGARIDRWLSRPVGSAPAPMPVPVPALQPA